MLDQRSFAAASLALAALLSGCATGNFQAPAITAPITPAVTVTGMHGKTMGGQQPVTGSTVAIYTAGSDYYAAAAVIPGTSTTTDANGNFNIGSFTCASGTAQTYVLATGGNPGLNGTMNNPNLALMAPLGPCSGIAATTNVVINERTTVAAAYALSAFISGPTNLGAPTTNATGLALAFADVNQIVDITTGMIGGPALPAGSTLPVAEINTLADLLASCVNTAGGTSGDNSACGNLFQATAPVTKGKLARQPGTLASFRSAARVRPQAQNGNFSAPTDTVTAICNIAAFPGTNVAGIYNLFASYPQNSVSHPFDPTLTSQPTDFTLAVNYVPSGTGVLSTPSSIAFDSQGNFWVTNKGSNSVVRFSHAGVLSTGFPYTTAQPSGPSSVAVDSADNAYFAGSTNAVIRRLSAAGASLGASTTGAGGTSIPLSIAVDPQGNVWVASNGANVVTEYNSSPGGAVGYTGAGIVTPVGIAISNH